MPDYPPAIRQAARAAARQEAAGSYTWDRVADAVLDAVAADLGKVVAARILAHMEVGGPPMRVKLKGDAAARRNMRRLHFQAAARIAARAFLTEDDQMRMAAAALAAGRFAACPSPEDGDEH